ncbi:Thylakoid lumenal 15.0 kDa protein 2, chloroplastic [Porphyridium purpureum]|uniref:Thylakoid lumenal 15.0 kDa protein 2, chloroplastic n=1 Tax=Porphyridium purpureum TaxID=35688 RepID=A0A5J4YTY5_PORPP|nr:Thylakoid lumenal 15.0 kDa protein 2, chloroplastic [Porphyridium purpureum]|eukprot:POR0413..scf227_4
MAFGYPCSLSVRASSFSGRARSQAGLRERAGLASANGPRMCQQRGESGKHGVMRPSRDLRTRRDVLAATAAVAAAALTQGTRIQGASARPEGVNKPELLPPGPMKKVIDLENYLTSGEEAFLTNEIERIEKKKGVKIRVLTQKYPSTPGAAIKDYWSVDDDTIVLVCDYFGGNGNLLKFNVGDNVYKVLPPRFWSLLASQYGNKFYIQKNGEDLAILNSLQRVGECLLGGGCMTP